MDSDAPDPGRSSDTPPLPMSPARRRLEEFEAQQRRGPSPRGARKRGGCAVVAALFAVCALAYHCHVRDSGTADREGAGVGPGTGLGADPAPDPRERIAADLLARARQAADDGQWATALRLLADLGDRYADTRVCTDQAKAIDTLRAQAQSGMRPKPTSAAVAKPDPQETTVKDALESWPAAFEDALADTACLDRAWLFRGQYGGHFHIHNGGLAVSGVHTNSACWWNSLVGERYLLSVEFYFASGVPVVLLNGPGYGGHPAVGYALRLPFEGGALTLELRRHGALVGLPLRQAPFDPRAWHRLDVLRDGGRIVLHLDGEELGQWHDAVPLQGAMHAFVGLAAENGMWGDDRPHYRNLAVRMPEDVARRLADQPVERRFDPPITLPPQANGERLFLDDFAENGFERWRAVSRPEAVNVRNGRLVLQGPNAWPVAWRNDHVTGSVAVEFRMAYFPNGEAINFNARLRFVDPPDPETKGGFRGWQLGYPGGNGQVWLTWRGPQIKERVIAQTSYFPATHGRPYTLRFEVTGRVLRLFVNDGFLLEATAPEPVRPDAVIYPGLFQIYGGSIVERVAAWRIAPLPDPGLVAAVAGDAADAGPRLAAAGCFAAAFDARVLPLLAERRYAEAREALAALATRPDYRLARDAVRLAARDVVRLEGLAELLKPPEGRQMTAPEIVAALDAAGRLATLDDRLRAALFLLFDATGDAARALGLLEACGDTDDARRTRALAARAAAR